MKLLNGPKTLPSFQMYNWIIDPLSYLETNAAKYGDVIKANFVNFPPFILISNPQLLQEVFNNDNKLFDSGKGNGILKPLLGDFSVMMQDGERHQKQRRLLIPPFHGDRMKAYADMICQTATEAIAQQPIGRPFAVRPAMQEISLRIILEAVFGLSENAENVEQKRRYQGLKLLLSQLLEGLSSPWQISFLFLPILQKDLGSWSPWGQFLARSQQIDQLIYAEIQSRRQESQAISQTRTDILSLLMAAKDEAGETLSDIELRDDLISLLVAGHETTASALAWAFYWIHQQPQIRDRLIEELQSLGKNPEPTAINQLPYLAAVCNETLRIYPIAMLAFPRVLRETSQILDYQFEAGSYLAPCIYALHHRPDLYPEPKTFRPERFLERQFTPYEFMPFGGGTRRCLGMMFALFEMKLVLATVLTQFQLELADLEAVKPTRRGVTLAPSNNLRLIVKAAHKAVNTENKV